MRRFLIWVFVPSVVASGIVSIPAVFVAWLGGWLGVVAGFGASFSAALLLGTLAWLDAIPVRRLLKFIKTTDKGVEIDVVEVREAFRLPLGPP